MSTNQPPDAPAPQPGWYPDPEHQGFVRYWEGNRWSDHPDGRRPVEAATQPAEEVPQGPKPSRPKRTGNQKLLLGIVAAVLLIATLTNSWTGDEPVDTAVSEDEFDDEDVVEPEPEPTPEARFRGKPAGWTVINPASVEVQITVTNVSKIAGKAKCFVRVTDPSSTYKGFDIFTTGRVKPGDTETFRGTLTVEEEGAAFVDDMTVDCSQ